MNKKVVIFLLVIILLLTILCLKITLVEFFNSDSNKKINNAVKEISDICNIDSSQTNNETIGNIQDCMENVPLSKFIEIGESILA
jgi:hypothetical protein